MAFWSRGKRGEAERPAPPLVDSRCGLCGLLRAEVRCLVAGEHAAVCDQCITYAAVALDGDELGERTHTIVASLLASVLEAEDLHAAQQRTTTIGTAAIELAHRDARVLRRVLLAAIARANPELAIAAGSRIDDADLVNEDRINLSYAYYLRGDFDRATAELPRLDENATAVDAAFFFLNRAGIALERSPPPSGSALDDICRDLHEARMRLPSITASHHHRLLAPSLQGCDAHVALLSGKPEEAEAILRPVVQQDLSGIPSPARLLLLGDALFARGQRAAAREQWEAALSATHPEGRFAAEARRRLQPEYR